MGKIKWNTGAAAVDEAEEREGDFTPYDGPTPGANVVLRLKVQWIRVEEFKSGNNGLYILAVVDEPKSSDKARFNGYPFHERISDTPSQDWKIKQFMKSIGGTGRSWANTVATEDDRGNTVVQKFGAIVVDGLRVRVSTGRETYEGEPRARVNRWLPKADETEPEGDDSADESGDSAPF